MTTYTTTADSNGYFILNFPSPVISGENISVTATKDSASKTIQISAPSEPISGGLITLSGTAVNFPNNIGTVTLSSEITNIPSNAFNNSLNAASMFAKATGLIINSRLTTIATRAFSDWPLAKSLELPDSLITIGESAFANWYGLLELNIPNGVTTIGYEAFIDIIACKKITLPASLTLIETSGLRNANDCDLLICNATTPPTISSSTLTGLKSSCIIKVPAASVNSYKSAANWAAFAANITAI